MFYITLPLFCITYDFINSQVHIKWGNAQIQKVSRLPVSTPLRSWGGNNVGTVFAFKDEDLSSILRTEMKPNQPKTITTGCGKRCL